MVATEIIKGPSKNQFLENFSEGTEIVFVTKNNIKLRGFINSLKYEPNNGISFIGAFRGEYCEGYFNTRYRSGWIKERGDSEMINYKKFQELKHTKLVPENKDEFLYDESLTSWLERCCKVSSGDKTQTMFWGSIKSPANIIVMGNIKKGSKKTPVVSYLLGIGKITENKSKKTIGWILQTDSGIAYFTRQWTEPSCDS